MVLRAGIALGIDQRKRDAKLATLQRQGAPLAFTNIGYRLLVTDEWKTRRNLPRSSSKVHLGHFPISDIGNWSNI